MRAFIFAILGFFLCTYVSCKVKPGFSKEEHLKTTLNDSVPKVAANSAVRPIPDKIEIKSNSIVKVVSADWESHELKPDDVMSSKCKGWRLSNESIVAILRHGKPISMHDFHYLYYVLPCEVKGLVEIDRNQYRYRINAGSFFTISNKDSTFYFECNSPKLKNKFLMSGGNPQKDLGL
ncbi:hypothetical protein HGH93_30740 [Chitinophaga polysaccharea]|uniref:hypothetical protein n=1 Tax=Chitinophaga TaxID=79328 RepID=UPI001455AEB0|nr:MULTISPECIES: hypothetical protein [Chitinophaga]NLR62509.1 hypothetical protein [Chitinophaga polysaccharea]NLU92321.1 hypothetical protein [Chitinophaga sp. Ak27]